MRAKGAALTRAAAATLLEVVETLNAAEGAAAVEWLDGKWATAAREHLDTIEWLRRKQLPVPPVWTEMYFYRQHMEEARVSGEVWPRPMIDVADGGEVGAATDVAAGWEPGDSSRWPTPWRHHEVTEAAFVAEVRAYRGD